MKSFAQHQQQHRSQQHPSSEDARQQKRQRITCETLPSSAACAAAAPPSTIRQPLHFIGDHDAVVRQASSPFLLAFHAQQPAAIQQRSALLDIGARLFLRGKLQEAMTVFDMAASATSNGQHASMATAFVHWGEQMLRAKQLPSEQATASFLSELPPVDTYHEDDGDVGPRAFSKPLVPGARTSDAIVDLYIVYNRALVQHARSDVDQAIALYSQVVSSVQRLISSSPAIAQHIHDLCRLAMSSHNNLCQIYYAEQAESLALVQIENAISFAHIIANHQPSNDDLLPPLDYATIISNWCRIQVLGDGIATNTNINTNNDEQIQASLNEILRIRSSNLPWDHVDVAAAHYNLGLHAYNSTKYKTALSHFTHFMKIASSTKSANKNNNSNNNILNPIPAVTCILLIKNQFSIANDKTKNTTDLINALHTLQDNSSNENSNKTSIYNYIGTLLFHQKDYHYSLFFFHEELCLEEEATKQQQQQQQTNDDDDNNNISVSVTCNNIGRILQELGQYTEAIYYYQRSLRLEFCEVGNDDKTTSTDSPQRRRQKASSPTAATPSSSSASTPSTSNYYPIPTIQAATDISKLSSATMNLYSTVWYNLGLIHDKMSAYPDAIQAFQMSLLLRKTMLGADHPDVACLLYNIGVLQMEQQMLDGASESFRDALRIRRVVVSTGQLNDRHVIKTLQKLSSLHRTKGNIDGALEACQEVVSLLKVSKEIDDNQHDMAMILRDIAELYHMKDDLIQALDYATKSSQITSGASILLFIGSLQHELCEPILAQSTFHRAIQCLNTDQSNQKTPLLEVSQLLACTHCAPKA